MTATSRFIHVRDGGVVVAGHRQAVLAAERGDRAFLGLWLARELRLPEVLTVQVGGEAFPVLWSIVGSAILALAVGMLTRRRRLI